MSNKSRKITYQNRKKQEWLNRYLFLKASYETYEQRIEEEVNRTQRLTSSVSLAPVVTGVKQDDIWIDVFENMEEIGRRFKIKQDNALDAMEEIEYSISMLENEVEKTILDMHYIQGMLFSEIEKVLPYSDRMIYNYHATALEHLKVPDYVLGDLK